MCGSCGSNHQSHGPNPEAGLPKVRLIAMGVAVLAALVLVIVAPGHHAAGRTSTASLTTTDRVFVRDATTSARRGVALGTGVAAAANDPKLRSYARHYAAEEQRELSRFAVPGGGVTATPMRLEGQADTGLRALLRQHLQEDHLLARIEVGSGHNAPTRSLARAQLKHTVLREARLRVG